MDRKFHWCIVYRITGFPKPTRTWLFNGQRMNLTGDSVSTTSDIENKGKDLFVTEGLLQFEKTTHLNDGIYTLVVSNSMGTTRSTVEAQFSRKDIQPVIPWPPLIHQRMTTTTEEPDSDEAEEKLPLKIIVTVLGVTTALVIILMVILQKRGKNGMCRVAKKRRQDGAGDSQFARSERIPLNSNRLVENPNYFGTRHVTTNGNSECTLHQSPTDIRYEYLHSEKFGSMSIKIPIWWLDAW